VSAADLAVVLLSLAALAGLIVLVTAVQSLLRTTRDLQGTVARLENEALPLVVELRDTVRRAGAEVDRVDDLLEVASAIQHTVEGASRLTFVAFSHPLIKVVALVRGTARGLRRALGLRGRRRRRLEGRRQARLARPARRRDRGERGREAA
jgi:predicted PurR-regulated permease PerM